MKNSKPQILLIHKTQFGYHNNAFKYCQYLNRYYDITFICFNSGLKKQIMKNINVIYVPSYGPLLMRGVLFMLISILKIVWFRGLVFVFYFNGAIMYKKLFSKRHMILDVRTMSISPDKVLNQETNSKIRQACCKFDYVTVISEGLRQKLNLSPEKSSILPLGADVISSLEKKYSMLRLLYVGTFSNRHLDQTIIGLFKFLESYPDASITYDIIGTGSDNDINSLKASISECNLLNNVILHGRIPNTELRPFFDRCNIGVSYVPITDYYDHQPVTKTFEYVMSGLFTIATATYCNKEVITSKNGILINDTSDDFAKAIAAIYNNREKMSYMDIKNSLLKFRWETIVNSILRPVLEKNIQT